MSEAEATRGASAATKAPRHVAIIMDGNGRWAAARGLPRGEGHRRAAQIAAGAEAGAVIVAAAGGDQPAADGNLPQHLTLFRAVQPGRA